MVNRKLVLIVVVLFSISLACSLGGQGEMAPVSVEISSPTEGAVYTVGQQIYVVSSAIADNGVAKVYLSVNGQVIGTEELGGLPKAHVTNFSWVPIAEGNVKLTVIATDGVEQTSEPVSVNVVIEESLGEGAEPGEDIADLVPTETITPQPDVPTDTPVPPTNTPPPTPTFTFTPHPPTPTLTPTSQFGLVVSLAPVIVAILPQIEKVGQQVTVTPGEIKTASVQCPAETTVVGGGFAANSDIYMYSHRMVSNGWRAVGINNGVHDRLIHVYAHCMRNLPNSSSQQVANQTTISANSNGYLNVNCPAGTTVVSGGFTTQSDGSLTVYNSSKKNNGWQLYASNSKGNGQLVNVYAVCLSADRAISSIHVIDSIEIAPNNTGGGYTYCSAGYATGGGYSGNPVLQIYNTSPNNYESWAVYAKNHHNTPQTFNKYAVCLTLD